MLRKKTISLVLVSALFTCMSAQADTLFVGANAYTLDASNKLQRFQAMAVDDAGRVLATGSNLQLRKKYSKTKQIDLAGKTVLPGLIDAHGHIFSLGFAESQLSLRVTNNLTEAQQAIAAYAQKYPKHQWILGGSCIKT